MSAEIKLSNSLDKGDTYWTLCCANLHMLNFRILKVLMVHIPSDVCCVIQVWGSCTGLWERQRLGQHDPCATGPPEQPRGRCSHRQGDAEHWWSKDGRQVGQTKEKQAAVSREFCSFPTLILYFQLSQLLFISEQEVMIMKWQISLCLFNLQW